MDPLFTQEQTPYRLEAGSRKEKTFMSAEKRKATKKTTKKVADKPVGRSARSKATSKRVPLTTVGELDRSRAMGWWLGLQAPDELDTHCYATAFAACMSLAGALDDDRAIELEINGALDNGLKSTTKVQRMQEALAVYFKAQEPGKDNQLRRALEIELSGGSNPITPIGIWAYLQRDYVANGKLTEKEAKVLEDTLVLACLSKGNIRGATAVALLRTGDLDGYVAQATKSGGCALPVAAIVVVSILMAAL
jgi:hypothetical protein